MTTPTLPHPAETALAVCTRCQRHATQQAFDQMENWIRRGVTPIPLYYENLARYQAMCREDGRCEGCGRSDVPGESK